MTLCGFLPSFVCMLTLCMISACSYSVSARTGEGVQHMFELIAADLSGIPVDPSHNTAACQPATARGGVADNRTRTSSPDIRQNFQAHDSKKDSSNKQPRDAAPLHSKAAHPADCCTPPYMLPLVHSHGSVGSNGLSNEHSRASESDEVQQTQPTLFLPRCRCCCTCVMM